MPAPPKGRTFTAAVAWALLALAAAELLCRALPPSGLHSYLLPRNPAVRYGWATWTEPRPREPGALVIVLSNSQGHAPELEDARAVWPAQLERELGEGWQVANWSLTAARGAELVLLAAQAARHRPELLLVVAGGGTFNADHATWQLGFQANDLRDLAALGAVRDRLPLGYLERTAPAWGLRWTDHVRAWSALVRLRDRVPVLERGIATAALDPPEAAAAQPLPGAGDLLLEELRQAAATGAGSLLFVGQPLGPGITAEDRAARGAFVRRVEARWAARPQAAVLDAIDAVPGGRFYTQTHMDAAGHSAFAAWLAPRVRAAAGR